MPAIVFFSRFVLGNKVVDVKAFKKPKYKQPGTATTVSNYPQQVTTILILIMGHS